MTSVRFGSRPFFRGVGGFLGWSLVCGAVVGGGGVGEGGGGGYGLLKGRGGRLR